jgi:hypothetical protein
MVEKRIRARMGIDGHESDGVWQRGADQRVRLPRTTTSEICDSSSVKKSCCLISRHFRILQRCCIANLDGSPKIIVPEVGLTRRSIHSEQKYFIKCALEKWLMASIFQLTVQCITAGFPTISHSRRPTARAQSSWSKSQAFDPAAGDGRRRQVDLRGNPAASILR